MSPDFQPYERTLDVLDYLAGAAWLAIVIASLAYAAVQLRRRLLPGWTGPPALVADLILGLTAAILLAELLGTFSILTATAYPIAALVLAGGIALWCGRAPRRPGRRAASAPTGRLGGMDAGSLSEHGGERLPGASDTVRRPTEDHPHPSPPSNQAPPTHAMWIVAIVTAAVFAGWAIGTLTGIAGGLLRADSLWYHMPLAQRFAETGSTGDLYFLDPIFFAHFYPANSEVLHTLPILAFDRDFISPVLNLGFLALGLLAAWAIGRPYGVAPQALLGAAVVLGAETMTDFQAGEALNDIVGVAFLLCAAAVLVNGHAARGALAVAGMAAGLAAGTKLSFLAPVALLTLGVVVIAPRASRLAATVAWSLPMLLAGGYWYARNLVRVGNPIPFTEWGPFGLPSPERAFELRPGFSISHYWNDTQVWSDWFFPFLAEELGPLWPLVLLSVVGGGAYALWRGREPVLRALGALALLTAIAYVFTPLTAGGEEGEPIAFEWNIRYLAPAIAIGLAVLPCLPALRSTPARRNAMLLGLGALALVTTLTIVQWPEGGHTKGAIATGALVLAAFAAAAWLRSRGWLGPAATRRRLLPVAGAAVLAAIVAGFLLQRHYLERRYENLSPQLGIAEVVRQAQDLRGARIAISGVRGVFNQYAFSGTDLSNRAQWLGVEGKDGAFLRIPDCETWRREVNDGGYDFVVTMYDPFNPVTESPPGVLTDTKEGLWTRVDPGTEQVARDGPVSMFRVTEPLDPDACGGLPDLSEAELTGDSVNLEQLANQPTPVVRP